ncbi:MAG: GNAT family N-acetyltransferase [Dehalococcoidia bacterium]|nr:GNAT family N-acetyltransferase [Dehalococcoidia bacterium]
MVPTRFAHHVESETMTLDIAQETFEGVTPTWDRLLASCDANTLFLTPLWQKTWWETLGSGGPSANGKPHAELMLLSLRDGEQPVGVAPMQRMGDTVSFLGDTDVFDYHDFIIRNGCEDAFFTSLCAYLDQQPWRKLYLPSVPEGSPTIEHIRRQAERLSWQCTVEQEDVSPGLALPSTWDGYLAGLSGKDRHELRRKMRRLFAATQPTFQTFTDTSVDEHVDRFLKLMRDGKQEKQSFLTPEREHFFRVMCRAVSKAGMLRLHFLGIDGVPVAAAMCFDYNGKRLLYNSGFSPEYYSLSVGLLLKALSVQEAIEKGLAYFDFLRGDEPYKYDLGGKNRAVYRITVQR